MRNLRNSLIAIAHIVGGATFLGLSTVGNASTEAIPNVTAVDGNAMVPLAVGNTWTYRCTAEGSHAFVKTVKLTAVIEQDGQRFYRTEMRIKRDPKPLVYFLSTGSQGEVFSVFKMGDGTREILITAAPKSGERIGERIVAVEEKMHVPPLGRMAVVRVENFSRDDPKISAEQRMEWSGRYYAAGVGLVIEADGLGGECILASYKIAGGKR